ncbi:MAG: TVP38/TMEM64 family protein [Alphaproteobacteria bacterium]|nr:TVP38/TMEM64 family protein [Alphaproteobacteria bacterium]
MNPIIKWTIGLLVLILITSVIFSESKGMAFDASALRTKIVDMGQLGPVVIVLTMAVAIVVSPLPSAPITALSGALYGHLWGAGYALIGAQLGAMIAFFIARKLGRKAVGKFVGNRRLPQGLSSQNGLTISVLISRLIPAISFDIVSYLAGLTSITTVRFSVATFVGMIPMTFLFSHVGDRLIIGGSGVSGWVMATILISLIAAGSIYANKRSIREPKT